MPNLTDPKPRSLFLYEQFTQESMKRVSESIFDIESSDKKLVKEYKVYGFEYKPEPIKLIIDSFGGQVYQCFGLISVIAQCKTPVHTIVAGCAMSCGFVTLIAGHKRFAYDNATIVIHSISSSHWGKLAELEESLIQSKKLQEAADKLILERTKFTKKDLEKIHREKIDLYLTAKEALKHGIIDEII